MIGLKDQCFGVEVEMTGITREQAATALAAYFATDARYVGGAYDKWCVTDRDGKEWTVMSDSSIHGEQKIGSGYRATGDYRYRVEMVTPKLTYAELPKLQECVRQVRHAGAKANSSCGIHVHVDAANHKAMHLLRAGVNMIYIRDFLGHVDISTTEVYARIDAEMKRKVFEEKVPNFTPNTTMPWEEDKDLLQWLTKFGKKSF